MLRLSRARLLALAAASAAGLFPRGAGAQAADALRFATAPSGESYLLPVYALESGIFEKHGLAVTIVSLGTAGAIATAVVAGAADAGVVDPILVANAHNHGVPMAFFAGGGLYRSDVPTTMLCTGLKSRLASAKELEGQSVGVISLSSISALGVKTWLAAGGADLDKIKFFEIPYSSMPAALNKGDLAAAFIGEPFLYAVKNDVRVLAHAYDAMAKTFEINGCFAKRAWLADNAALAKRLVAALDEAAGWANGHLDDSAAITAKYNALPLETARGMTRVRFAPLDPKLLQPVLDAAYRYKSIDKPVMAADIVVRLG